jgi:glycosyltransferase involved in cell wall biosynthesis
MSHRLHVCQVLLKPPELSETFISAVPRYLAANVTVVDSWIPQVGGVPVLSQHLPARVWRRAQRSLARQPWEREITLGYEAAFRRFRADVALAEFGPAGTRVLDACTRQQVPLVVRFHGYDAYFRGTLEEHGEAYRRLFASARAVIAPSHAMVAQLQGLGAPSAKTHCVPYGIDCETFSGACPGQAPSTVLAVGRFVEKKAPHLTLLAFRDATRDLPDARLRFIGDGRLLDACRDLAIAIGIGDRVVFLGAQPPEVVQREMRSARVFAQHSVLASSGDSEGLPVSILEAGAAGLPVVATRHAGIPEMIREGLDGYLVDERDVAGMSAALRKILESADLAQRMGAQFQARVRTEFSIEITMSRLLSVLEMASNSHVARA